MVDYINKGIGYQCKHCDKVVPIEEFKRHYKIHRDDVREKYKHWYEEERQYVNGLEVYGWNDDEVRLTLDSGVVEVTMERAMYRPIPKLEKVTRWYKVATNVTLEHIPEAIDKFVEKNYGFEYDKFEIKPNKKGNFSVFAGNEVEEIVEDV